MTTKRLPARGDWMKDAPEARVKEAVKNRPFGLSAAAMGEYNPEEVYEPLKATGPSKFEEAMQALESGKAKVRDAWLFCGRWSEHGKLLRESDTDGKPYRLLHLGSDVQYRQAVMESKRQFNKLKRRMEARRAKQSKKMTEAALREDGNDGGIYDFQSFSDAGSLMVPDPNQFTEYTPMFNGPFHRQQYYDFFKTISRAFEEWNHNPVSKRIVNILTQYALGRGFEVRCEDDSVADDWSEHMQKSRLKTKMRKFWGREYLVNGELLIDLVTWNSIDSSTIYDIVSDIENPDDILYYQQMYQSYTQAYAGIDVPNVPGSKDSKIGQYFIRQIPYDRVVFMKNECFSNEKRGRSILFSIMGWCKRLKDLYNAQVVGEQARSNYIFDDTIEGNDGDVMAHAQRYSYMMPPASIFAHNAAITRKPMAPMAGVSPSRDGVGQEILALIATAMGIPKDHLNVIAAGSGSRATAVVASEPFTKVIEDLQQDFEDLTLDLIDNWCQSNGIDYDREAWDIIFPSVTKDSTGDAIKNWGMANALGAVSKRRMATSIAAELEISNFDYDDEVQQDKQDATQGLEMTPATVPPDGRLGSAPLPGEEPSMNGNPIHGNGKQDIIDAHKTL